MKRSCRNYYNNNKNKSNNNNTNNTNNNNNNDNNNNNNDDNSIASYTPNNASGVGMRLMIHTSQRNRLLRNVIKRPTLHTHQQPHDVQESRSVRRMKPK